ncbi:MAG TPA: TadE/TadG family type IV pilus assembly protein [Acidobacteriaceae bacterium]|jgi:Flp pilus assembly protein TadG|nr:TadE/TadG family type IV pilus assembly protein [Acidobacteriaceae bacterium]
MRRNRQSPGQSYATRALRAVGRLFRERSGTSILELALILAFFGAPLIVGTAEVGFLVYDSIEISNAAHAGAIYGMQSNTNASNTSVITTAARSEASDFGTNLTVTPTVFWVCSTAESGTQYTTSAAATTACTGSTSHPLEYLQVNVSAQATPPIHFPVLPATYTLTGSSIMEVEE